ncbi:helitron_like_N domain-containing protein [Trichonephila clavata]|uniref:Helitron_like_N domain-containing protein n=1 Tax=Trichonephila clavata TaxID=2740835 RepID=A0A8X6F8M7_TRICU|nr:helitron_like_N domain-containing protein [Trichonephila clavata]
MSAISWRGPGPLVILHGKIKSNHYLSILAKRHERRKCLERAHQSEEQITARNTTQRIRISESRIQKSKRQRDERLRQNISRNRVALEQHIATFRVRERERQQASRALSRASFFRLAFEYAPDINYSANFKITIGAMDKVCPYCQALKFRNETPGM